MKRLFAVLPALTLAACGSGGENAPASDTSSGVQGEVLEGSISDEMIPVDRIRSQSPRAAEADGETGGSTSGSASEPGASEGDSEPASEPASETDGNEEGGNPDE